MSWDDSEHAGFSSAQPWMKVNQDYKTVNVKSEQADPDSVLNYYKKVIALRKDPKYIKTFTYGNFIALEDPNEHTLAYLRQGHDQTIMVIANFGAAPVTFDINKESSLLLSSGDVQLCPDCCKVKVAEGSSAIILL